MRLQSSLRFFLFGSLLLLLLGGPCHGLTLYDFGNPTDEEQLYLELINRARANPSAEGARLAATTDPDVLSAYSYFSVNLTLMQSEFNAIAAQPPLAPNASLTTSARGHSAWMLATATQAHNESPTNTPFTRMTAAGYSYSTAGENIYASAKSVWYGHAGFEVDWGTDTGGMQTGRGHRVNIHSANFREIGVGVVLGTNGATGPQLVTEDFGTSTSNPTLGTGVAYYDLNANNFYDLGEGISGLTVNVSGASYECTTATGGGWVVPVPTTATTRTVTFSGLNMNQNVSLVVPASKNAKADLKLTYAPPAITSSANATADIINTLTFNPVGGASGYKWNRWTVAAAAAENCENTANITSSTTGTYAVRNTSVKQQGTSSFHLENTTAASQSILLSPLYYGQASPSLSFQSSIRYATTAEQFKVQIKEEGSTIWQDVFSQTGTNTSGESTFNPRSATLTGMTGKAFRVRFLLNYGGGGYYTTSGDIVGWFIDAIAFTGVATLGNNVSQTLSGTSGSFTPSAGTYLMSVAPVISNRDFPASYQTLTVTGGGIIPPAIITTQPASITIPSNTSTILTVAVSGTSPTFQWYQGSSGVTTNPVSGATSASYTTPALTTTTSYWVRVTNGAASANSNTATVTIAVAPVITTQPASITINSGATTTLTVAASGTSPTFQWYQGSSGVTTNPVSGATGTSYTTPALTATTSYWVRASNPAGSANSNTAAVTVNTSPVITTQPASIAIKNNTATTLTVAASGNSLKYQWYKGISPSTSSKISGATSANYTTPTLTAARNYWVRITNPNGTTNSNTAAVTIAVAPAITTQPASITINSGNTATFSVTTSGSAPTFQWYLGAAGVTTTPVSGATGSSFSTPALTTATSYWVRATNAAGSVNSNTATATVNLPFNTWAANLESANLLSAGTIANHPNDDFDHDGRANLIEYAFGTSPVIGNDPAPRMPVAKKTATHFVLQYQRDISLTDITLTVQACSNLGNWKTPWETGAPSGFTDAFTTSGGIETHEAKIPLTSGNCFMRVRITRP